MDKFEQLKEFKKLMDEGIISSEEFEAKKKELLFGPQSAGNQGQPKSFESIPAENKPEIVVPAEDEVKSAEPDSVIKASDSAPEFVIADDTDKGSAQEFVTGDVTEKDAAPEIVLADDTASVAADQGVVSWESVDNGELKTDAQEIPAAPAAVQAPAAKKSSNKTVIIIAVVALVAIAAVAAIMLMGGSSKSEIEGSWHSVSLVTHGEQSMDPTGTTTFKATGETWEMNLTLVTDGLYSGTFKLDGKQTIDGNDVYLYDLTKSDGGTLKAMYDVSSEFLYVFASSSVDTENLILFKHD
jgi:hypothetical protein